MPRRIPERPPNCDKCGKPIGGKGWYGPGCMCDVDLSKAKQGHSAGQTRAKPTAAE